MVLLPAGFDGEVEEDEEEASGTAKERPSETARRRSRFPFDIVRFS
jgi:hypothetical protein